MKKSFTSFVKNLSDTSEVSYKGSSPSFKTRLKSPAKRNKIFPKLEKSEKQTMKKSTFKLNRVSNSSLEGSSKQEPLNVDEIIEKEDKVGFSFGPVNLLNLIKLLMKAVNMFRFRTKFRGVRFINERQIGMIEDVSYFPGKTQKEIYLKRYTEKKFFKRLYYNMMSLIYGNWIIFVLMKKYEKIMKFLDSSIPVIKPYQKIKVLWDILILLTIVGFFFIIPLQLSFEFDYEEEFSLILESYHLNESLIHLVTLIPELLLVLDTLLKFITGFYENGIVIIEKSHIINHYLKKGLIFDLLSYCPILAQSILHERGIGLRILQLLVFCKLKRVQIILHNFQQIISLNGKHDYILSLIILTAQIIFFCHINACIWHSVAFYYPYDDVKTWLDYSGIKNALWMRKYYYSIFWSIAAMVTIGCGDKVSPQNDTEMMIASAIYLSSTLLFGYIINCMREIFDDMAKNAKEYKDVLSEINKYMSSNSIDFELQGRVRKYLEYIMCKESNHGKENEILSKLTPALKRELILEANVNNIYQIPLFSKNFSERVIEELAFSIKQVRYSPEEYIFHKGEIDDFSLFIVAKGNLELIHENEYGFKVIDNLKTGDVIGAHSFFTDDVRDSTVCSHNFSTLFQLKKVDFMKVIRKYPEDYEKFIQIKDQIKLYSSYQSIDVSCICCSKRSHLYNNCPLLHYIPDTDFLIKRYLYSPVQERKVFHRKSRIKYNALFNNSAVQTNILCLASSVFSMEDDWDDGNEAIEETKTMIKRESLRVVQEKTPEMEDSDKNTEKLENEDICENESKIDKNEENFKKYENSLTNKEIFKQKMPNLEISDLVHENLKKMPIKTENLKKIESMNETYKKKDSIHDKFRTKLSLEESLKRSQDLKEEFKKTLLLESKVKSALLRKRKVSIENLHNKSLDVITATLRRKTVNLEKDSENKHIASVFLSNNEELFNYDFEKMRIYHHYFPNNNSNKVCEIFLKKSFSPNSGSKRNRKKVVEMRIRGSKLNFDFHFSEMKSSKLLKKDVFLKENTPFKI